MSKMLSAKEGRRQFFYFCRLSYAGHDDRCEAMADCVGAGGIWKRYRIG